MTVTIQDTIRGIRTPEATSSSLQQTCSAVIAAYDTYIQLIDNVPDYQELRMGLAIERYRIDLWRRFVLAKDKTGQGNLHTYEIGLWGLFECILTKMLEIFSEIQHTMEKYRAHASITSQEGLSGALQFASIQLGQRSHEGSQLPETMSTATKSPPEYSLTKYEKTLIHDLLEKKHVERLLQTLCYWNDSLDGLILRLDRESARRRLRAHFFTSNIAELRNLEAAAAFLKHKDIKRMANVRSVIEQEQPLEYRLETDDLEWQDIPHRPRTMATLWGKSVIVDWQNCINDR